MSFFFYGKDLALKRDLVKDLNDGGISKIIITPGPRLNQIYMEIIRPLKSENSGFEYVDIDEV